MRRSWLLAPALLVGALALAGCGGTDSADSADSSVRGGSASPAAAPGPHNAADVGFAQQMVPRHEQALEMVGLTSGHDLDPVVRSLAGAIEKSESKEVATLKGWLGGWGETLPTLGEATKGMLSTDQVDKLRTTDDDQTFQAIWLALMVQQHQGAIPTAQAEITDGSNPEAVALAREIVRNQEKELSTMDGLTGP